MSKTTQALIQCPHCNGIAEYNVFISANVTVSPTLRTRILDGSLFWKTCKGCGVGFNANHDLLYHDMEKQFCVWLKYKNEFGEIELERGAERADKVFKDYRLRIAFARYELIEKIELIEDGYDDVLIETVKLFHSIKNQIDMVSPFYYHHTETKRGKKTLVFIHNPKDSDAEEHRLDLANAETAVRPFLPQIASALTSEWAPWMWVIRGTILNAMEDSGLATPLDAEATKPEDLISKAEILVPMANSLAIASLNAAEKFLSLPSAVIDDLEKWDFFMTVAAVEVALKSLAPRVSDETFERLAAIVLDKINEWNSDGLRGLEDCQRFVSRSLDLADRKNEIDLAAALGMWILCNIYNRCPTYDESAPARLLGGLLIDSFTPWWDSAN